MTKFTISPEDAALLAPLNGELTSLFTLQLVDPRFSQSLTSCLFEAAIKSAVLAVRIAESRGLPQDSSARADQLEYMIASISRCYTEELAILDDAKLSRFLEAAKRLSAALAPESKLKD